MLIKTLADAGGLLFILTIVHFILDWIFQSDKIAMSKHSNSSVRAQHCLLYAIGFIPIMFLFKFQMWEYVFGFSVLFITHYIEDSYVPLYLWAKYIRKPLVCSFINHPMDNNLVRQTNNQDYEYHSLNNKKDFYKFCDTQLGKILVITVDQIIHIVCE